LKQHHERENGGPATSGANKHEPNIDTKWGRGVKCQKGWLIGRTRGTCNSLASEAGVSKVKVACGTTGGERIHKVLGQGGNRKIDPPSYRGQIDGGRKPGRGAGYFKWESLVYIVPSQSSLKGEGENHPTFLECGLQRPYDKKGGATGTTWVGG